jgi:hypothetical protein
VLEVLAVGVYILCQRPESTRRMFCVCSRRAPGIAAGTACASPRLSLCAAGSGRGPAPVAHTASSTASSTAHWHKGSGEEGGDDILLLHTFATFGTCTSHFVVYWDLNLISNG